MTKCSVGAHLKIRHVLIAALLALGAASAQAQTTAAFLFDNTFDDTLTPPFVGSGLFTFANDPGVGTHPLTSLGSFSMSYVLGAATFTEADITTPLAEVLVLISPFGPGVRRLQFSNTNGFGSGGLSGSIDFIDGATSLSFEPPDFGGGLNLYVSQGFGPFVEGTYQALISPAAIPEPSTYALMLAGLGIIGFVASRRRKEQATA